jgi:hypothetical protein
MLLYSLYQGQYMREGLWHQPHKSEEGPPQHLCTLQSQRLYVVVPQLCPPSRHQAMREGLNQDLPPL